MSVVLPNSLLILVHLHLLNYPLKDASGYDDRLFDPMLRGIRERTKAMEDISYFLVGQVEEGRERARSVSANFWCFQAHVDPFCPSCYRHTLVSNLLIRLYFVYHCQSTWKV